jgi:hypothetical protein
MAFTISVRSDNTGTDVVQDISAGSTGQKPYAGAKTIWAIYVDNTLNTTTTVYFKMWDNSGTVNVGGGSGTEANMIIPVAGGTKKQITVDLGIAFASAVVYACVTGADAASSSAPSNAVPISLLAS